MFLLLFMHLQSQVTEDYYFLHEMCVEYVMEAERILNISSSSLSGCFFGDFVGSPDYAVSDYDALENVTMSKWWTFQIWPAYNTKLNPFGAGRVARLTPWNFM